MNKHKILVVAGTRPEVIKLAPVIHKLKADNYFSTCVCLTGQHQELVYPSLKLFKIQPDYQLNVMQPNQTIAELTAKLITSFEKVIKKEKPDAVLVQGDTTSAFSGALAAFYNKTPIAHVEAGLRTNHINNPFPEEMNRVFISKIARYHFAPTEMAVQNLLLENIDRSKIYRTGNTTIDSLFFALKQVVPNSKNVKALKAQLANRVKNNLLLVTIHRRENQGENLLTICDILKELSKQSETSIIFPLHPNPQIRSVVEKELNDYENIMLIDPQPYDSFVWLMSRANLIITDSGGIQEEAPSLGVPVIVLRDYTERAEGLISNQTELLPLDKVLIKQKVKQILTATAPPIISNIYGDGKAAERIVHFLKNHSRKIVNALFTTF